MRLSVAIVLSSLIFAACGSPQSSDDGGMEIASEMPRGDENPDALFARADTAFIAGDYDTAERAFTHLYILSPDYRGGVPAQALREIAARTQRSFDLMEARANFIRDAFYGAFNGPRSSWVPAQENDYRNVVACYDLVLAGDANNALAAGGPVTVAPYPPFAQVASHCTQVANAQLAQAQQRAAAERAFADFQANAPCMNEQRSILLEAEVAGDWETFVNVLPGYRLCADVMQSIVDSGVLRGDPRVGLELDIAYTNMSEVDAIAEDNAAVIAQTRAGLESLDANAEFSNLMVSFEELRAGHDDNVRAIASLSAARDALGGSERRAIQNQIDALESEQRGLRREMREVLGRINRIRRSAGLQPIDAP